MVFSTIYDCEGNGYPKETLDFLCERDCEAPRKPNNEKQIQDLLCERDCEAPRKPDNEKQISDF